MSRDADVRSLETFRDYLRLLAPASEVGPVRHRAANDAPGPPDFRGQTRAELAAWLCSILTRNLSAALRHLGRAKRNMAREQSLESALEASSMRLEAFLASEQSSPSVRADCNEQLLRLAEALAMLPDAQREAVTLHHLQGWPMAKIAEQRIAERFGIDVDALPRGVVIGSVGITG